MREVYPIHAFTAVAGATIDGALREVLAMRRFTGRDSDIYLLFNDVPLRVRQGDTLEALLKRYYEATAR